MKRILLLVVVLCTGCTYGPEHLPALYNARDAHGRVVRHIEAIIFNIERTHKLESRGSILGDIKTVTKTITETVEVPNPINERLLQELQLLEDKWFATLQPEDQLKWRMHRDQLRVDAKREVQIYQNLSP